MVWNATDVNVECNGNSESQSPVYELPAESFAPVEALKLSHHQSSIRFIILALTTGLKLSIMTLLFLYCGNQGESSNPEPQS